MSHLNRRRPNIGTLFFGVDVELGQRERRRKSEWEEINRVGVALVMVRVEGASLLPWRNDNVGEVFCGLEKSTEICSISEWISSITFSSDFKSKSSVRFQVYSSVFGWGLSKTWLISQTHFSVCSAREISTKIFGAKCVLQWNFTISYPFDQSKIIKWNSLPSLSLTLKRPSYASFDWFSSVRPLKWTFN